MSTKVPLKGFSLYLACSICMANIDILCAFATLFFFEFFLSLYHVLFFAFVALLLSDPAAVAPCTDYPPFELHPPSPEYPANRPTMALHLLRSSGSTFICLRWQKKKKKSKIEVEGWPSYYANEYFPCDPAACFCHPKCPAFRIVSPVQWRVPADRQWVSCWFSFVCLKPLCKHFAPPRQRAQTSTPLESDCQLHNEKEWQKMR